MIFTNANQAVVHLVHHSVGKAQTIVRAIGSQKLRLGISALPVEWLVSIIREVNDALMNNLIAAAVLVHSRARVETRRIDVFPRARSRLPDDHLATGFGGPAFNPINVVAVYLDLTKADGFFHDQTRGYR